VRVILFSTLIILTVTYAALLLLRPVLFRKRAKKPRPWRRAVLQNLAIAVPLTLMLLPVALGYAGSRLVRTRPDEAAYQGPRFAADGQWLPQSRDTLAAEAERKQPVDPVLRASQTRHQLRIVTADGLRLRAFLVPPKVEPPAARVIMVHGLFRGSLELEPVARMFHDLGAEVLMLELRNHGFSDRAPATYGLKESQDVLAAAQFMQQRPSGDRPPPLVLFGVSLGTAAVALAAPQVPDLAGLVLDAPMTDLQGAARRDLSRGLGMPGPLASAVVWFIEAWSSFSMDDVHLDRELSKLREDVHVLVIGAGHDRRCPPAVVREVFASVAAPEDHKELWILETARHGRVWEPKKRGGDPEGYRRRLAALLARIRGNSENR